MQFEISTGRASAFSLISQDEYRALTREELNNRIKAHLGSDWLRPAKGSKGVNAYEKAERDLKRHYIDHGNELGYNSLEQYKKAVYDIIKSPDMVYIDRRKGKTFYNFIKGDKIVISEDDSLRIVSFYPFNQERWESFAREGLIRIF
jgi:hypothetical protein